jgi:hypothetical protein
MKNEKLVNSLEVKTGFLCEQCGKYGLEHDMEIVSIKLIKHKSCELNVTKDQTYDKPALVPESKVVIPTQEEAPKVFDGIQVQRGEVRDIVPNGIKKNDPRFIRPNVSGPNGMKIPSVADMMKEPGA